MWKWMIKAIYRSFICYHDRNTSEGVLTYDSFWIWWGLLALVVSHSVLLLQVRWCYGICCDLCCITWVQVNYTDISFFLTKCREVEAQILWNGKLGCSLFHTPGSATVQGLERDLGSSGSWDSACCLS